MSTSDGGAETEGVPAISVTELDERRRRGDALDLVDVRDSNEWEVGRIEGARLAPLPSLADALASFDGTRDVVVYCKGGARSARAVRLLQAAGVERVWMLDGGLLRWAEEIDPTVGH